MRKTFSRKSAPFSSGYSNKVSENCAVFFRVPDFGTQKAHFFGIKNRLLYSRKPTSTKDNQGFSGNWKSEKHYNNKCTFSLCYSNNHPVIAFLSLHYLFRSSFLYEFKKTDRKQIRKESLRGNHKVSGGTAQASCQLKSGVAAYSDQLSSSGAAVIRERVPTVLVAALPVYSSGSRRSSKVAFSSGNFEMHPPVQTSKAKPQGTAAYVSDKVKGYSVFPSYKVFEGRGGSLPTDDVLYRAKIDRKGSGSLKHSRPLTQIRVEVKNVLERKFERF
jgi:hypothetical protein